MNIEHEAPLQQAAHVRCVFFHILEQTQLQEWSATRHPVPNATLLFTLLQATPHLPNGRKALGLPFVESDISAVRDAVDATSTAVPWAAGDLTIVDNRRFAHGRQPYTGSREVRVCMTGEGSWV